MKVLWSSCREKLGFAVPGSSDSTLQSDFLGSADRLERMLGGTEPMSLREAVFAMEAPVVRGVVTQEQFNGMLERWTVSVKANVRRQGGDVEDPLHLHQGIQALFSDSLRDPTTGKAYPDFATTLTTSGAKQTPQSSSSANCS